MHNGAAKTVEEAILMHDGEGAPARDLFLQLTQTKQGELIAFLESLGAN